MGFPTDDGGIAGAAFSFFGSFVSDLGEADDEVLECGNLKNGEAEESAAKVSGTATGVVPVEDDAEGFDCEIDKGQGSHPHWDDKEKKDPCFRCNKVKGGENSEQSCRSSNHGKPRDVAIEEAGHEEEEDVEESACDSTKKVESEVGPTGHPSFDVGSKEKETDAVCNEMTKIRMKELKGQKSPDLEFVNRLLNTELPEMLEKNLLTGPGHKNLKKKDSCVDDQQPFGHRCSLESPGHTGGPAAVAGLHVVAIIVSHTEEVAVIAGSGK